MLEELKKDAADRMAKCVAAFRESLRKMRTGRANVGLLDALKVLPTSGEGSSERSAVLSRFSQLYAH